MKKYITIIILLFTFIISIDIYANYSYAAMSPDTIIKQGNSFLERGKEKTSIVTIDGQGIRNNISVIFGTVYVIGVIISVIVIAILGIKTVTGSVGDKAEYKERMLPYIIGAAVIFGSYPIWKIVMAIAGKLS